MKRILVTGCNGQLGRAINEEYKNDNVTLINTDVAELDITKVDEVLSFVEKERPDVIINCAAHTNVNACETQFDLAFLINAIGPRNLSIAASKIGAKMIHVSTDYVFDGSAIEPYTEFSRLLRLVHMARRSWQVKILLNSFLPSILLSVQHGYMEMVRIL